MSRNGNVVVRPMGSDVQDAPGSPLGAGLVPVGQRSTWVGLKARVRMIESFGLATYGTAGEAMMRVDECRTV